MSFTVWNLSENQADCFLIILERRDGEKITILVDGNKDISDYQKVKDLINEKCDKLDFIVVTHVDNDHLGGVIKMLEDAEWQQAKDTKIFYNHVAKGTVSYEQAETFERLTKGRTIISSYDDNLEKIGFMNILSEEDRRICPEIKNKEYTEAFMTLIKPYHFDMNKVRNDCKRVLNHEKKPNSALINRNSFVFLLEFEGKSAIFTGDANWKQIEITLNKILPSNYSTDLIKIPHHGAEKNNIGLVDYAKLHNTKYFLVTGNKQWDECHPAKNLIKEIVNKCPDSVLYTLIKDINEENIKKESECTIEKQLSADKIV